MAWAPDYATTAELRAYRRVSDSVDDTELAQAISSASRTIDQEASRQFGVLAAAEARIYMAHYDRTLCRWFVNIDDLMTTTNLAVAVDPVGDETFTGSVGSAYVLKERNAAAQGRPWTRLEVKSTSAYLPAYPERLVRVTAIWGWSSVPDPIVSATLLQASRYLTRRDTPLGIAGGSEQAPALRLIARADPDVQMIVRPFRREWAVA